MPGPATADAEVDQRVADCLPLVRAVVASLSHHYPRHCDRDELLGAGALGLVEAARRFEPARGVPFERWAAVRIRGAVIDAARAQDVAPRSVRSRARDLDAVRQTLTAELGRTPQSSELAERMGLSVAELSGLQARLHRSTVLSLDAPADAGTTDHATLASIVLHSGDDDPLEQLERRERDRYVTDAVALLPDRLRAVLIGYYFAGRSSAELADDLGVTESRVSQLRSEALELIRRGIAAQYGEAAPAPSSGRAVSRQLAFNGALGSRSDFAIRISATTSWSAPLELLAS